MVAFLDYQYKTVMEQDVHKAARVGHKIRAKRPLTLGLVQCDIAKLKKTFPKLNSKQKKKKPGKVL